MEPKLVIYFLSRFFPPSARLFRPLTYAYVSAKSSNRRTQKVYT